MVLNNKELEINQEQINYLQSMFVKLSTVVNNSALALMGKKLNLSVKLPRLKGKEFNKIEEDFDLGAEISKLANVCTIIGEFMNSLANYPHF